MDPHRVLNFEDPGSGLRAVLVIDNTALGPAAGGVRTAPYASLEEAGEDADDVAERRAYERTGGGARQAVSHHVSPIYAVRFA